MCVSRLQTSSSICPSDQVLLTNHINACNEASESDVLMRIKQLYHATSMCICDDVPAYFQDCDWASKTRLNDVSLIKPNAYLDGDPWDSDGSDWLNTGSVAAMLSKCITRCVTHVLVLWPASLSA